MSVEQHPLSQTPPLALADSRFHLSCSDEVINPKEKEEKKAELLEACDKNKMVHLYVALCDQFKWQKDEKKIEEMKADNAKTLEGLKQKIEDAEENLGESEVREATLAKADHFCRVLDKENAIVAYGETLTKTIGLGEKLDIVFTLIRLGIFWKDSDLVVRNIEKAKDLLVAGGDWDRKNRLKAYEGLHFMSIRSWDQAATLFLETLSTYTCTELFDYKRFIFYTVLMSLVTLTRPALKKRVIESPEVHSVIETIPSLGDLMNSFYNAEYRLFFSSLGVVVDALKRDRFLSAFAGYFCREMRIKAYNQLLESYRSLQIKSVADAFGVTPEFIDTDLSRFIYSGRVFCKLDAVRGIIETSRHDVKNTQYQMTLKSGDNLMHRVQKLSRVII